MTNDPHALDGTDFDVVDTERRWVAESPLWDHRTNRLYWVDVPRPAILRIDPANGAKTIWEYPEEVGSIGLHAGGGLVAAMRSGFYRIDADNGQRTLLAAPEADRPENRFNDGKVDRQGRFWAGSLQMGPLAARGRLWRLDPDRSTHCQLDDLACPNGLAWSPDGRVMYFTDSFSRRVEAFDFDPVEGAPRNRRFFAEVTIGRGVSDGATVDADGYLWCANAGGWAITRYDPAGRVDRVYNLPVRMPTSCCFGGPRLDILYVTTASRRLSEKELAQQPAAGCLLALHVGARGLPEPEFGVAE